VEKVVFVKVDVDDQEVSTFSVLHFV